MDDAQMLDRIDIRWEVRTRCTLATDKGEAVARGLFMMTLGTYSGPATREIMADNVNARGIHQGDLESVECAGGAPDLADATRMLARRGLKADDIVSMRIQTVIVDDSREIAESQQFDDD